MTTRRLFLKSSGLAMFGIGAAPMWLARAADGPSRAQESSGCGVPARSSGRIERGGPVWREELLRATPDYRDPGSENRRTESVVTNTAIDLDGFFGLHPSLAPLKPIYDANRLAIVHAVGSPDPTRSHFDAQDYMESGTPGRKATADGWLNRALPPSTDARKSPVRAVSLGPSLSRALRGRNEAVAINNLNEFKVADADGSATFESMYASTLDKMLSGTGRETFDAVKLMQSIQARPYTPTGGAKYPGGRLGQSLMQIARLIKADVGLEVAFADVGGWDTHVNEVGQTPGAGQLANLLGNFGQALAAFYQDLGDRMEDVAVVTMSEFGRTARENGNRGTDHGHANVMFAFGGEIRGGKVFGEWPGLAPEQLYENRDLALTTDFRDVLGELVAKHLGNGQLAGVFPEHTQPKFRGLIGA